MRAIIAWLEEETIANIRNYMYLNKIGSISEALENLVAKGIHAICKEGRGHQACQKEEIQCQKH